VCLVMRDCGVSRYGGILLHSDRFKHINNVARILLQQSGLGLTHKVSQFNARHILHLHKSS